MPREDDDDIPPAGDVDAPRAGGPAPAPLDPEEPVSPRLALALGGAALVALLGACGYALLRREADPGDDEEVELPTTDARLPAPAPPARSLHATLSGPCGEVTLPRPRPTIVNVWLQGCADCMPAFDGWKALRDARKLPDVPIVNVAYGSADGAWADAHGVGDCVVFDRGGARVVRPLGISSFTTLVVDARGEARVVGRPESPGYLARLEGALGDAAR
jgi:hypothetical protein